MSRHKVECQCCGMMMVPKTIFSRGFYGGWGVWLGGGYPLSSYCPFCLSEGWNGVKVPVEKPPAAKLLLLWKIVFAIFFLNGLLAWFLEEIVMLEPSSFIFTLSEWLMLLLGVAAYQKLKFSTN